MKMTGGKCPGAAPKQTRIISVHIEKCQNVIEQQKREQKIIASISIILKCKNMKISAKLYLKTKCCGHFLYL